MKTIVAQASIGAGSLRFLGIAAVCILLAATLLACAGGSEDSARDERVLELEERVDDVDARLQKVEEAASKAEPALPSKEQWFKGKGEGLSLPEGTALERTVKLVDDHGGEIHFVDHPEREDRSVLVTPVEFVDGETLLIVSLHGFGGDSAYHSAYFPIHERLNTDGFALLLPNGARDGQGNRFWNPTDRCCEGGKSGEDDVAILTELVAEVRKIGDFGPVYFFGF